MCQIYKISLSSKISIFIKLRRKFFFRVNSQYYVYQISLSPHSLYYTYISLPFFCTFLGSLIPFFCTFLGSLIPFFYCCSILGTTVYSIQYEWRGSAFNTVGTVCTTGTSTSTAETVKLFSPAHLAATANLYFDYRLVLK